MLVAVAATLAYSQIMLDRTGPDLPGPPCVLVGRRRGLASPSLQNYCRHVRRDRQFKIDTAWVKVLEFKLGMEVTRTSKRPFFASTWKTKGDEHVKRQHGAAEDWIN